MVVESPVVVLCNFAGKGLPTTFLAGIFATVGLFAEVGFTLLGEEPASFLAGAPLVVADFLVLRATGDFFAGTDFTAFLATSFFATSFFAGGDFFTALFLAISLLETAFLAGAFFAVGVISIVTSLVSPHMSSHQRPPL